MRALTKASISYLVVSAMHPACLQLVIGSLSRQNRSSASDNSIVMKYLY